MKEQAAALAVFLLAASCAAQSGNLSDWHKLLEEKDLPAAKALCTAFTASIDVAQQAEAHKCLANVVLSDSSALQPATGDSTIALLKPEAADEALKQLNLAIQLTPQDISVHRGRLFVLEKAGRYMEMAKALDDSCAVYKGPDTPDLWFSYSGDLASLRQYDAGLAFNHILDKYYADSSDIEGNIGSFLLWLNKPAEAIPYLLKAAALAPQDATIAWNLGRSYDGDNQDAQADKWYQKSLSLETDSQQLTGEFCHYGEFVERKFRDRSRACYLEKKNCPPEERTACK